MANPRQRRKARSSSHKAVSHSRHAKKNLKKAPTICGPKVLQEAWNKKKTVRQNYLALGLVHSLNPSASGGREITMNPRTTSDDAQMDSSLPQTISSTPSALQSIPKGHGRIIRDDLGNVVSIELSEEQDVEPPFDSGVQTMQQLEPGMDKNLRETWVTELGGADDKRVVTQDGKNVVAALERISATNYTSTTLSVAISGVGPRHAASGETRYLQKLLDKYGGDVERMARDSKLNYEQRSVGQLRRALTRAGLDQK